MVLDSTLNFKEHISQNIDNKETKISSCSFFVTNALQVFCKLTLGESLASFKYDLNKLIRPISNSICNTHNTRGIQLPTRLRLGLIHLRDHKFRHKFSDTINSLCTCSLEIESTFHFFLHCHVYITLRPTLFRESNDIDCSVLNN